MVHDGLCIIVSKSDLFSSGLITILMNTERLYKVVCEALVQ